MSVPLAPRFPHEGPPRDPSEGMFRRASIAAALGLLIAVGLFAGGLRAAPQEVFGDDAPDDGPLVGAAELEEAPAPPPPITLGGAPADQRAPADLLPADGAVAFLAFAGTDVAGPALAGTAAHEALVESGLFPALERSFGAIMAQGLQESFERLQRAADGDDREVEMEVEFEIQEEEADIFEEIQRIEDEDGVIVEAMELEEEPEFEGAGEAFETTPQMEALRALGEAAARGGATVSVSMLDGPPLPSVFVVLPGAADEAEAALSTLSAEQRDLLQLREVETNGVTVTAGNIPGAPPFYAFGLWRVGDHLVAAVGPGATQAAAAVTAGTGEALGDSPLAEGIPEDALLAGWLNFAAVVDKFGEFPVQEADWRDSGQVTLNEISTALGLDALAGYRGSISADGEALRTEGEWTLRGAPRGLLAALDPAPLTMDDLPPLPAEVGGFVAVSLDYARIYDGMIEAAAALGELQRPGSEERELLTNAAAMLNERAGFDVRASLLDPLGHVTAIYGDPHDGGLFGLSGVAAYAVDDAEALKTGLAALEERLLPELPPEASEQVVISTSLRAGVEVTTVSIAGMFRPSFAVTDDWVVFAPNPQSVHAFLLRADGTLPRWAPGGRWAEPFARVPAEFTLLSATDPRPTAALLNTLIGTLLPPINQFAGGPADLVLPPSELVTGPLFPNVGWATNTGGGVRGMGYSSLPAPLGMSGGGSVATPAILVSLLLPAIQQAREAARRAQSQNNLKQLGLGAHNYHSVYNTFPRGTAEGTNLPPEQRLSHFAALLPFIDQSALADRVDPKRAWDAGLNAAAARRVIPTLVNPSVAGDDTTEDGYAVTHYVGIAGVGANAAKSLVQTGKTGVFGYNRATGLREVRDGTTTTLMYGSVHEEIGPWAQGGASTVRAFTQQPYINGPDGFGGHVGGTQFTFADGSVRFISETIDPEVLEALATANGGETIDDDF